MPQSSHIPALRNTYQIKIQLQDIKPPIWRRLLVDSRITLDALHVAIQSSMGWLDTHLHQFVDQEGNLFRPQYTQDDFAFVPDDPGVDESVVLLSDILLEEQDWFNYEYDFGDDWKHKITLEKVLPYQSEQLPVICIKGKRACPPEDSGGSPGYMHLSEILAEPEKDPEEYEDIQEWLGEQFDPELFDLDEVNLELKALFESADFNNSSAFEKVLQQLSGTSSEPVLPGERQFETDDDIEKIISSLNDTLGIISDMSDLLDEAYAAFEKIAQISQDKQVLKLARNMLKRLE